MSALWVSTCKENRKNSTTRGKKDQNKLIINFDTRHDYRISCNLPAGFGCEMVSKKI